MGAGYQGERNKLLDKIARAKDELFAIGERTMEERSGSTPRITDEDIAEIISEWTKIPLTRLTSDESERLLNIENDLHERVIVRTRR